MLCFSTLACPSWPLLKIADFAQEHGYQGIEVRGLLDQLHAPNIPEFQQEALEATRALLVERDLELACLSSACEIQRNRIWGEVREMAFKYIDIAAALGAPYVRVLADCAPSPMGNVDDFVVRFNARELGTYAADRDITVLIESNGVFADSMRLRSLMEAINHPNVGVLWDINHPVRFFGEAPEITYNNLSRYIKHVHVKDSFMSKNRVQYCALGDGDLPLRHTIRLLQGWNYSGYYSLEWLKRWETELDDPETALALFPEFMEKVSVKSI